MKRKLTWIAAGLTVLGMLIAVLGAPPNRDLRFSRDVFSEIDADVLGASIDNTINWPKWNFMMEEAKRVDARDMEFPTRDQVVAAGAKIKIVFEPRKESWRRFQIDAQVAEYLPHRKIRMILMLDHSGKIYRLFDHLEWTVELLPPPPGSPGRIRTWIRGSLTAHTSSMRARLFSRIDERTLLNQAFYPDLISLSRIDRPLPPNPLPATQK